MSFQNLFSGKKDLHGQLHCHKHPFWEFWDQSRSDSPSQNTLRQIKKFEEYSTFMDSLIAGFIQFSSDIAKSLFLQSEIGQ